MLELVFQIGIHTTAFVAGAVIVVGAIYSAVETFVLPRSAKDVLTRFVFRRVRSVFALFTRNARTYAERDRAMAFFAPVGLLALPPVWIFLVTLGYTLMFWAIGYGDWEKALEVSGSSILTLGFVLVNTLPGYLLAFSEALTGLILIALLIAYLPTIYATFQRREQMVNLLEVRAGSPPTAWEMLARYQRIHGLDRLTEQWRAWELWFADVEESHTSIFAVVFFRSQQPERSWITAAGAILDAAAMARSVLDIERDPQADLCIRAGYIALRRICDFFRIPYNENPKPDDPISIARTEFDKVCADLQTQGVPLKADRAQAWRDYAGWRVNYDVPLLELCALTMAPYAPRSSDRSTRWSKVQNPPHGIRRPAE
ncbi:MAG: hypothetical protein HY741_15705 [Chloroflexi bacterium]|nr:hypothetical protein [Chloroflexota bacterium]